jgi:hypothetical protein
MTDWSQSMAEKIRKRGERQAVTDAKFVETQRLRREVGPRLWEAVVSDLRAEAKALNFEMEKEILSEGRQSSPNDFTILANLGSEMRDARVVFSMAEGKLTYAVRSEGHPAVAGDTFEISVGEDGRPSFYSGMIPYRSGSIAKQILESLLD